MCASVVMAADGSSLTVWLTEQVSLWSSIVKINACNFYAYFEIHPHASLMFLNACCNAVIDDSFNIPCVQECPEIGEGLKDIEALRKQHPLSLPPLLRRLVNDAYMCIYVDPNVGMTP